MVVPGGGARLVVLLVLLVLAPDPLPWGARAASPADDSRELQQGAAQQTTARRYLTQELHNDGEEKLEEDDEVAAHDPAAVEKMVTDVQVGCRELRAKRFISDGFCTSIKPIREVVCAGNCLPIRDLPWYAEFVKVWAKSKVREWQCEEDMVQRQWVHLLCRNGQYRKYRIKVVKSCKCKKTHPSHNRTDRPGGKKGQGKGQRKTKNKNDRRERRRQAEDSATSKGNEEEEEETAVEKRGRRKGPESQQGTRTVAGDGRVTNAEGAEASRGQDQPSGASRGRRQNPDDAAFHSWR